MSILVVNDLHSPSAVKWLLGKVFCFFYIFLQVQVFGLYSVEEFHETFDCPIKVSACFNL